MSRQVCLRCADPLSEEFGERFLPIWLLSVYYRADPDLPTRLSRRGPLNVPDTASFCSGDERGYTDYPEWAAPIDEPRLNGRYRDVAAIFGVHLTGSRGSGWTLTRYQHLVLPVALR